MDILDKIDKEVQAKHINDLEKAFKVLGPLEHGIVNMALKEFRDKMQGWTKSESNEILLKKIEVLINALK